MVTERFDDWHTIMVQEWFDDEGRHLEYDVLHGFECSMPEPEEQGWILDFNCGMNNHLAMEGNDCLGITEPGKYSARLCYRLFPATPAHGDEWEIDVQTVLA